MDNERAAGILLHPVSIPSSQCIGDLGPRAYWFVDFMQASGARLWQILPLGPTGYGESPYDSPSAFAGNTHLISLELLKDENLLTEEETDTSPCSTGGRVDYNAVRRWKVPLLNKAAERFIKAGGDSGYTDFCRENSLWLDDYVRFACSGAESDIETAKVLQYFFFSQWSALKKYVNGKGIKIIGDVPIFVSRESADFRANPRLFHTDKEGNPTVVAGVPPDYFSSTGQLWGNPLYDWKEHKKEGYSWWLRRIGHLARITDIVRIDHFRGFEAYWAVPAGAKTAENGRWIEGSGADFFRKVREEFPDLEILAEDLGVITDKVRALRDRFGFSGMKVLQFAFERGAGGKLDTSNVFLPYNHTPDSVVYTGTHDNNTTRGWYNSLDEEDRDLVRRYLARPDHDIVWDLIREGMKSCARYAVFPMQDLLDLGEEGRMNLPSTVDGNWSWKMDQDDLNGYVSSRFREMAELYGRL